MNEKHDNDVLIENIQSRLEASLETIDATTQSKITRARHRALDQLNSKNRQALGFPAAALATLCLAVVIVALLPETDVEETAPVDDLELISNIDDLELLEELEFYEWLEDYELPT